LRPVNPGDSLHALIRVESLSAKEGKKAGMVRLRVWTRNQHGDEVMTQVATALVQRRTLDPP
jgi:acyl dehydratase